MDEADVLSDKVAIIDHGKIIVEDDLDKLKEKYGSKKVIQLKFDKELDKGVLNTIEKYSNKYYIDIKFAELRLDNHSTYVPILI